MFDETPNYDEEAVRPMREELVQSGFEELRTADAVDAFFDAEPASAMVVINSVCGCAAGGARPGARLAVQNGNRPERLGTVFAGQDKAAVRRLRERLAGYPPSSPFIALFKGGEPVHVMQRQDIEGRDGAEVSRRLTEAFEQHC